MDMLSFAYSLLIIVTMGYSFALRKTLADKMFMICGFIFLLFGIVSLAYPFRGHHIAYTVFNVVCFIWIAVCVATSYAFYEFGRRLFSCNENTKSLPALMGTGTVVILGIIACTRLLQWICA